MNVTDLAVNIYEVVLDVSLILLGLAFLLTTFRIVRGPTLPDRVLGLDMLTSVAIGFIAIIGIYTLYVDIAIALGLVGFLATVAFARFILARGRTEGDQLKDLPFRNPNDQGQASPKTERRA